MPRFRYNGVFKTSVGRTGEIIVIIKLMNVYIRELFNTFGKIYGCEVSKMFWKSSKRTESCGDQYEHFLCIYYMRSNNIYIYTFVNVVFDCIMVCFLFNGISTLLSYTIPKIFLQINSGTKKPIPGSSFVKVRICIYIYIYI